MQNERADMVFTDPPYNVKIDGNVCGLGSVRHREFAMATGEMSEDQFAAFLTETLGNMAQICATARRRDCVWERVFEDLTRDRDNQYLMLDSTLSRAHQQAANGKGGPATRLWGVPEED